MCCFVVDHLHEVIICEDKVAIVEAKDLTWKGMYKRFLKLFSITF